MHFDTFTSEPLLETEETNFKGANKVVPNTLKKLLTSVPHE